jgi:hypothetical protein
VRFIFARKENDSQQHCKYNSFQLPLRIDTKKQNKNINLNTFYKDEI